MFFVCVFVSSIRDPRRGVNGLLYVCFENKLYSVDYYGITFFETIERYESCIVLYVITILHVGTHSPLMSRTTSLHIDRVGTCSLIHRHGASHRMPDAG